DYYCSSYAGSNSLVF
nr:immunoglobulin light chain junction region [Macaca mulatta]MOV66579.1 immunoglobulin light chain junction region [Macaca mulatta]MOV67214.1 immunoglobulin light chain junction region [Macaca mulatta]MOV70164.1 immunoglobulin light chain junction region [Macaca mulatta]MOV70308.1 immunoglobulin light chain junction region [Macaca mulatta]